MGVGEVASGIRCTSTPDRAIQAQDVGPSGRRNPDIYIERQLVAFHHSLRSDLPAAPGPLTAGWPGEGE